MAVQDNELPEGTDQIMQRSISKHTLSEGLPVWS